MQSVTIGNNQAGQRLDKFLHKYLPEAGSSFLYKMLRKKNITLNGKKAEGKEILSQGDVICCFFSDETFEKFSGRKVAVSSEGHSGSRSHIGKAEEAKAGENTKVKSLQQNVGASREYRDAYRRLKGITVLYEDEHIVALNKPAGILTQKAGAGDMSLNEWFVGYLLENNPSLEEELPTFRPSVCNRLDRNTSGIVLCGKSLAGLQYLSRCIKERTIGKYYRTICQGIVQESATVEGYLVKDNARNQVSITANPDKSQDSSRIKTGYTPIASNQGYTLLEVELITGKTHQIRAHLASLNHPLIGDFKYGNARNNQQWKKTLGLEHHLLHAYRVEFPREEGDVGGKLSGMQLCAPVPKEFQRVQKELGL